MLGRGSDMGSRILAKHSDRRSDMDPRGAQNSLTAVRTPVPGEVGGDGSGWQRSDNQLCLCGSAVIGPVAPVAGREFESRVCLFTVISVLLSLPARHDNNLKTCNAGTQTSRCSHSCALHPAQF